MASWLKGFSNEEDKGKDENDIELKPTEIKAKLDKIDGLDTEFKAFRNEAKTTNDRLTAYLDEQEKAKRTAEAETRARKVLETKKETETELDELWLTDPKAAADRQLAQQMQPLVTSQINTSSLLIRQQLFNSPETQGDYEYYTGDMKKAVDDLIDSLPLHAKTDPTALQNCYYVALGRKQQEIKEGKIKSRFAASSNGASNSSSKRTDDEETPALNDAERKAAKVFGMTEKEYAKNRKDLVYV